MIRTHPPTSARVADREIALDAIRAGALVRVVIWHTFGAAAITYFVAAVPAMFFVTGSLLAQSYGRRRTATVLADRLYRLLLPLAAYATVALVAMAIAFHARPSAATEVPWRALWTWYLPLTDPRGSPWTGEYLSSALWYMRALLWILLLSPLLIHLVRRRPIVALAGGPCAVFALDLIGRFPRLSLPFAPDLVWQAGDIALYGTFAMLGVLHRDGRLRRFDVVDYALIAIIAAAAAISWYGTQPIHNKVVNNSHPMHLLVGLFWLAIMLAASGPIERAARSATLRPAVHLLSRRSLTIYLWHPAGIVLSYRTVDRIPLDIAILDDALLIVLVPCTTAVAVVAFGWIEDLAGKRRPQLLPFLNALRYRPLPMAVRMKRLKIVGAIGLVAAFAAALPAPGGASSNGEIFAARKPPVPSQAPPRPEFVIVSGETAAAPIGGIAALGAFGRANDGAPAAKVPIEPLPAEFAAELDTLVRNWADHWEIEGVEIAIVRPGSFAWSIGLGTDLDGREITADTRFDIGSITKTFTATLAFQLVDAGLVGLDAPLPELTQLPGFSGKYRLTLRNLLTHRTGLVNYRDTPEAATPSAMRTPLDALRAVERQPLKFEPGARVDYSSTNFLVLGLLIEQLTGRSFDALVRERFVAPLGLSAKPSPAVPGNPNFSTSGYMMPAEDVARWMSALHFEGNYISKESYAVMAAVDRDTALGAGSFGYCPCTATPDGAFEFASIGHNGGTTIARWYRPYSTAFVLNLTKDVYTNPRHDATQELLEQLRTLIVAYIDESAPKTG